VSWWKLSIAGIDGEVAETLHETLHPHAPTGVVVEEIPPRERGRDDPEGIRRDPVGSLYRVSLFLPADADHARRMRKIEEALFYLRMIRPIPAARVESVAQIDGSEAWKEQHPRFSVGEHWMLSPSFDRRPFPADRRGLWIEPGSAFGLGTHPSTRLCLELLERHVAPGTRLLDVGCGSGILSVAAARLGATSVVACDIDPAAIPATRQAARLNGVEDHVEVIAGSVAELCAEASRPPFDWIVMNIVADVIAALLPTSAPLRQPGGKLLLAGLLDATAPRVEALLPGLGLKIVERAHHDDWQGWIVAEMEVRKWPVPSPPKG
jgi:ribosomal protein L11 methyltransferase